MKTPSFIAAVLTILLGVGIASAPSFATDLGSLVISTEPGTVVLWDENLLGTADESGHMTISGIPLGTYAVSFRHDGFEGVTRQLDIVAGDQALEVSLDLGNLLLDPQKFQGRNRPRIFPSSEQLFLLLREFQARVQRGPRRLDIPAPRFK